MLITEMPALGGVTLGEATAMTGLAPFVPDDSGTMRKVRIRRRKTALRGLTVGRMNSDKTIMN